MLDGMIGRKLRDGEYELREVIARGGQATVYRAYSRSLETDVAVKVLAPQLASDIAFRERLHDEARSLARLHHPNLVEVFWYGEEGEYVYIAMRLVPGGTLKDRLTALGGPLGLTDTARTVSQVAEALQHAHGHDLVHMDVKPANVLLGGAEWPLVADLGITQAIEHEPTSAGNVRRAGTPAYMSPEQCRGGAVDGRSDQYSLAVMAYELLTGRQPFNAQTTEGLLQQHQESPPPRPRTLNPGLPGPVEEVLLRGLAKDPQARFGTIREFGQALNDAVERTRGVSLEAKAAAASSTPNLIAMLALVLTAPLLLAMLPVGNLLGRLPLSWPFQLLLAGAIGALLLGIRWHLIGLVGRGVGGALDALDRATRAQFNVGTSPGGPLRLGAWRASAQAAVEGVVNLLYLVAIYRLVGSPALTITRQLVDPPVYHAVEIALAALVGVIALFIVVGLVRSAGALAAALVLALGWAAAVSLPTANLDLAETQNLAWLVQLVAGSAFIALFLVRRAEAQLLVGRMAAVTLGRLLVESQPGITPEQAAVGRRQLARLAGGVLDFGYLLLGYALLRAPLTGVLSPLTTPLTAAIVVTGLVAVLWLLLIVRLRWVAGLLGIVLGIVLGAPVLVSLPVLDVKLVDATWPATIASWLAGIAVLLLLAAVRGRTQTVGQAALGARLDRGLLGTRAARDEQRSVQRASALGGVAGALIDVAFLIIAYLALGVPVASALITLTGQPVIGSLMLGAVVLASLVLILIQARRAAKVLEDDDAAAWRNRTRAFAGLAVLLALLMLAIGATPAVLAQPNAIGGLALRAQPLTARLIVSRDVWEPFSPRPDQATYNLTLACSDGRGIGQFREAFRPSPGATMPAGNVGPTGLTDVPCDNWQREYTARRHAAGLSDAPSRSLQSADYRATVGDDGGTSNVVTLRFLYSAGSHSSITWPVDLDASDLSIKDANGLYPFVPPADAVDGRYAEQRVQDGRRWVTVHFPAVSGPSTPTYLVTYHSAALPPATALFQQKIVPPSIDEPIWSFGMGVHVLPKTAQWQPDAVGSPSVRFGTTNTTDAWFTADSLPGGGELTVALNYIGAIATPPPAEPTSTPTPTPTPTAPPPATPGPVFIVVTATPAPPSTAEEPTSTSTEELATETPTALPAEPSTATPVVEPTVGPTTFGPTTVAAPTSSPTSSASPVAIATPTASPTGTPMSSGTASQSPNTSSATPTASPTPTQTPTPQPNRRTPPSPRQLTLAHTGAGSITSLPGGINCGPACVASYDSGNVVTLTAAPAAGYVFSGWTGVCQATPGPVCMVTMNSDHDASAAFTAQVTLHVATTPGGRVTNTATGLDCPTVSCTVSVPSGTPLQLSAVPDTHFRFGQWTDACVSSSTAPTCTIVMDANHDVGALFVEQTTLTVDIVGTGIVNIIATAPDLVRTCAVDCEITVDRFTNLTLNALESRSNQFTSWGSCVTPSGATCTAVMNASRTITANFEPAHDLTVVVDGGGSVQGTFVGHGVISCPVLCVAQVQSGTSPTLTATANTHSAFTGWSGPCATPANTTCSLPSITGSIQVTAHFVPEVDLTVDVTGAGRVRIPAGRPGGSTTDCSATVSAPHSCSVVVQSAPSTPTVMTLRASDVQPDLNFEFIGWGGACSGTSDCVVSMDTSHAVSARFARVFDVTLNVSGGTVSLTNPTPAQSCDRLGCHLLIRDGTAITLQASPSSATSFAWSDACHDAPGTTCTLVVSSDLTVGARFTPLVDISVRIESGSTPNVPGTIVNSFNGQACRDACVITVPIGTLITLVAFGDDPATTVLTWSPADACAASHDQPGCILTAASGMVATVRFTRYFTLAVGLVPFRGVESVTFSAGGIDCPDRCIARLPANTRVTLSPHQGEGVEARWADTHLCENGGGNACRFTLVRDTVQGVGFGFPQEGPGLFLLSGTPAPTAVVPVATAQLTTLSTTSPSPSVEPTSATPSGTPVSSTPGPTALPSTTPAPAAVGTPTVIVTAQPSPSVGATPVPSGSPTVVPSVAPTAPPTAVVPPTVIPPTPVANPTPQPQPTRTGP